MNSNRIARSRRAGPTIVAFAASMLLSFPAAAQNAYSTAAEIVAAVEAAERSSSSQVRAVMTIRGSGEPRRFEIRMLSRGDDASFVEFLEPRTVRGLRILSLGDETWVFFPSTGRVRKISGASRSGSVQGVGGDFSYEDLGSADWSEEYEFVLEAETATTWTVLGRARKPEPTYNLLRMAVDRARVRATTIEYSTPKAGFTRVLHFSEFRNFGAKTMPSLLEMRNLQKSTSSELRILEASYEIPLDDRWFSPERFFK